MARGEPPAAGAAPAGAAARADRVPATVRVRLFAAFRDAVGVAEVTRPLPAGDGPPTAGALWRDLVADHPRLAALPPAVAINAHLARLDAPLVAGDEVAFLPPVSGG